MRSIAQLYWRNTVAVTLIIWQRQSFVSSKTTLLIHQ